MRVPQVACGLLLALIAVLTPELSRAVPARPVLEQLTQPDGTLIWARQVGDEWLNGLRTHDGYTILLDEVTGFWIYAEPTLGGGIHKSGLVVGRDQPAGIQRGLPLGLAVPRSYSSPAFAAAEPMPNLGSQPVLAILVDFTPSVRVGSTAASLADRFFGASASVKHYFEEVSYGLFAISPAEESDTALGGAANDGIVSVTLAYPHPNPGSVIGDPNRQITRDALIAADSVVNFALFDTDGDGRISSTELHIVIIVAGYERAFSSSPCGPSVWGHLSAVSPPTLDGKRVGESYAQFGEWHCSGPPGHAATIGIMVHELGHDLGLPDLYDADRSSEGIGEWGVMGSGSWNGVSQPGDSPAHMDPWSKYFEGWITPTVVTGILADESIAQAATSADVYQLLSGTPTSGEYFLVENRQRVGYDAGLPGAGLLIWHIDASKFTNSNECYPGGPSCVVAHYQVAVVQADNLYNLEIGTNRGDAGDAWPGSSGRTTFGATSTPNSNLYGGSASDVSVTGISASGAIMSATLLVQVLPTVTITATEPTTTEAALTPGQLTVSRTGSPAAALTVFYTVSGTATAGSDYGPLPGSVTIPAGASSVAIPVVPVDDDVVEADESVMVTLSANAAYAVGVPGSATVTILSDDVAVVTIGATNPTAAEAGLTTAQFTVSRTGGTMTALTVFYAVAGTATAGSDYGALPGSVTIPAGATSVAILVVPVDDGVVEPEESVVVTLSAHAAYQVGPPGSATVTILSDDVPTVTITVTHPTATEAGLTTAGFTVSRTGSPAAALTVFYTASGTATAGSDYGALPGSVTIPAGATSVAIPVVPVDDGVVEPDESVVVMLSANAAYAVGVPSSAVVTILSEDVPTVTIGATNPTAAEAGLTTAQFTVSRTGGTVTTLTVFYTVTGTATAGSDYGALPGSVTIPAGATSVAILVVPVDDGVVEPEESVVVTLSAHAGYQVGPPGSATVTILSEDVLLSPVSTVTIGATDPTATEAGLTPGQLTVSRTGDPATALTVFYTVTGTATAGSDYGVLPGSVTIPAGAASAAILVTPIDDGVVELDESVVVTLSANAAYAVGVPGSATVTILSDDGPPVPDIDVQPASWDYGLVPVGSVSAKVFTVTNTGPATLNVTGASLVGPDADQFAIISGGEAFSLASGESRTLTLGFGPTATGSKSAALRLTSNDPDETAKEVPLGGTGNPTLVALPPTGHYAAPQVMDVGLMAIAPGQTVMGVTARLNGIDVTAILNACLTPGTLASGGQTFRCAGVSMALLRPGTNTLDFTAAFTGGLSASTTITWSADRPPGGMTVSPPTGDYLLTQVFDLAILVNRPGRAIVGGRAVLNGVDVTLGLAACVTTTVLGDGSVALVCAGVPAALLGPGVSTLQVTLDFDDGSSADHAVDWHVHTNTEP